MAKKTILELIASVRAATGPDREIDGDIYVALGRGRALPWRRGGDDAPYDAGTWYREHDGEFSTVYAPGYTKTKSSRQNAVEALERLIAPAKRQSSNSKYIQKRRRRWYAVMEIPASVRAQFGGKPRFVKSLGTESQDVAERRALAQVGIWKQDIAKAKGQPGEDDATYWGNRLRRATSEKERRSILDMIDMRAWDEGAINVENIGDDPFQNPEARRFYSEAVGWTIKVGEHIEEWLASQKNLKEKTRAIYKTDVERFAAEFPTLQDVTRPAVRRWVTKMLNSGGLSVKSVRRGLSPVRSYWKYLESINAVSEDQDPFVKIDLGKEEGKSGWLPFSSEDVVKLLAEAKKRGDQQLADLIDVDRWTGARIEELCSLQVKQVHANHISIEDSKTEAGIRDVPIHPKLAPVLKRLIGKRTEGYLFEGLTADKYGDRSPTIGRRFGTIKTKLGFGRRHVFHSIRKTVSTQFENAHVPEGVAADILGHEKPTMTYGVYSGGSSMQTKRKAILKLEYPG